MPFIITFRLKYAFDLKQVCNMALALFDLDNTLLAGDSDYSWGQFLVSLGVVDAEAYNKANQQFYEDYKAGKLDIHEFARFAFKPLVENSREQLEAWREQYVEEIIRPIMTAKGQEKINWHKQQGDEVVIITATNSFITQPIAKAFAVEHLIATEPARENGQFIADIAGIPCFQNGKVKRLHAWLDAQPGLTLEGSWFYSDSHNDLPLLEQVSHPIVVDPDQQLGQIAATKGWVNTSFRD